jgi:hypothetical protein
MQMDKNQLEQIRNAEQAFPRVTLWEKNGKSRLYVDSCGYITKDQNDISGRANGYFKGFYYQYSKPGKVSILRDIIRVITSED